MGRELEALFMTVEINIYRVKLLNLKHSDDPPEITDLEGFGNPR